MESINLDNAVIIDTETTGLSSADRICEISVIDAKSGQVLYTSLINPQISIPAQASAIHGITNDDVKDSPVFFDAWEHIEPLIKNKTLLIYNADFDIRMIIASLNSECSRSYTVSLAWALDHNARCVMRWYAYFYGSLCGNDVTPRFQRLTNACYQQGIDTSGLKAHRSLSDCEMTRLLINAVNAKLGA
ncbi:3'-5' exonuclease [Vibrio metschnikovii]|uniref:3'-5' exonuclease n=1 Tax=Vibrio metschnikovii TaxID=28172 RepID=UPI002FCB6CCD